MLAVIILGMMSLAIYRLCKPTFTAMRVSSEADAVEARYDGLRELRSAVAKFAAGDRCPDGRTVKDRRA